MKIRYLIFLFLLPLLISCKTKIDFSNPKEVALHYQELLDNGKVDNSFTYVSDTSKKKLTLQDYLEFYNSEYDSLLKTNRYVIQSIKQMPVDANHSDFRSYEIKHLAINIPLKDTSTTYVYWSLYNQGDKGWRIVWTKHIEMSASGLNDKSKFEEVIEVIDQIIKDDPLNGKAYLLKAWAYYQLNNLNELEKNVLRGRDLAPNDYRSYTLMGLFYSEKGLNDLAKISYKKAISLTDDNNQISAIYSNLSIDFENINKLDSSIYYLRKAILFDAKQTHALWRLAIILGMENKSDSSFHYFEKAIANSPMSDNTQHQLYYDYAVALLNFGDQKIKESKAQEEIYKKGQVYAIKALELDFDNSKYKNLVEQINNRLK
jgi:tetratricopeptide (TPR) repeat protein